MYQDFAVLYDDLMVDVDYAAWAGYYMSLLQNIDSQVQRIVECGCGTGSLTRHFAKHYQVLGIDQSPAMLQIAYDKLAGNPRVQLSLQDMQNFQSHGERDAVLATCDAVNYLLTEKNVLDFFLSANRSLKPGGQLLFDVSSRYKLFDYLPSRPWVCTEEALSYIWQNFVEGEHLHMVLSLFVKEGEDYSRVEEEQVQTCFPSTVYCTLLAQAGFGQIRLYGDQSLDSPRDTEHRWHFQAIKLEDK